MDENRLKYRKPTDKEKAILDKSREMMQRGIEGEKDFLSKISTTMAKSARDEQREAKRLRESVPESARNYEGLEGMKAGGSVSSASKRADGCAMRGKTRGRMV
jgi:hypothetical protein